MLIGIDMIGLQCPSNRERGIGRFTRHLVAQLITSDIENRYLLYYHADLPPVLDLLPDGNVQVCVLKRDSRRGDWTPGDRLQRALDTNEHGVDLFLETSPLEMPHHEGYRLPARPLRSPKAVAIVFDFIRYLYPEHYLQDARFADTYYESLRRLQGYDGLLAISGATQDDAARILGVPTTRIHRIGCATDPAFRPSAEDASLGHCLRSLGIDRPFVLNVGGEDVRKNLEGLLAAFGLLPGRLREHFQLVIACALSPEQTIRLQECARAQGIAEQLVLTNHVSDELLRTLYQSCAAFVFPSTYEGFGLPLLEAMCCGAPVIAGRNSSQVEVVGEAGLLVHAEDPVDIAAKLRLVLQDAELARTLRQRSQEQAQVFRWTAIARRTREAFGRLTARHLGTHGLSSARSTGATRPARPRIAVLACLPSPAGDVGDQTEALVQELATRFAIDLYQDDCRAPSANRSSQSIRIFEPRLYPLNAELLRYDATFYQIGKPPIDPFMKQILRDYPGIVTIHVPLDWSAEEARCLDWAKAILVAEPSWVEAIQSCHPDCAGRVWFVPPVDSMKGPSPEERLRVRSRLGLAESARVIAALEPTQPDSGLPELLDAFAAIAHQAPEAELFVLGRCIESVRWTAEAQRRGIGSRAHFVRYRRAAEFGAVASVADVVIAFCSRDPCNPSAWLPMLGARGVVRHTSTRHGWSAGTGAVNDRFSRGKDLSSALLDQLRELGNESTRGRHDREAASLATGCFQQEQWSGATYAALITGSLLRA
jgi:glycosyltransferase involved in cell wall biosynthesis